MRPFALFLVLTMAATPTDEGFTPLFDGKSLAGWTQVTGKASAWAVEGGNLVMLGEGGGWIGTGRDYADFILRFEFKMTPGSNSGVYLRAPAEPSHISRTGMEIQLLDDPHPRYKDIKGWQKTGAIYHVVTPKPGHLKPAGEWNAMEIRAQGARVTILLNGTEVVDDRIDKHPDLAAEHPGLARKAGRIGLQSHDGRVEFRLIRVRELGEFPTPGQVPASLPGRK